MLHYHVALFWYTLSQATFTVGNIPNTKSGIYAYQVIHPLILKEDQTKVELEMLVSPNAYPFGARLLKFDEGIEYSIE